MIMRFYAGDFRFRAALQCLLTCFTLVIWQTTTPSSVHVGTEVKPSRLLILLLSLPNYLWMLAERSLVGLPTEVMNRKISIPIPHLKTSVDAVSLSNLSWRNIRLKGDLKLYLLQKKKKKAGISVLLLWEHGGNCHRWQSVTVYPWLHSGTEQNVALFRIMLRGWCFWYPYSRNSRKSTGVALWIAIF